jgi:AbrB family looped-hinge helix DNA binding protein
MKKYSTVTRKGQVTIPQVVREKLGIAYGEKVEFSINEHDEVVIKPLKRDLNDLYGILSAHNLPGNFEDHRRKAREWVSDRAKQRG